MGYASPPPGNDLTFSDGHVWANSVDLDQIVPEEQSDQILFAIPSASFGSITLQTSQFV